VSPDGRHVAFFRDRPTRSKDGGFVSLYVVGGDGRGFRRLSSALPAEQTVDNQIAWSPDGRRFIVPVSRGGHTFLYLIGPGRRQRAIANASILSQPARSPDGRLIAFRTGAWPNNEVWAVTPSGRRVWRMRAVGSPGLAPARSPSKWVPLRR
jgi:Tol biopolymer transport system component